VRVRDPLTEQDAEVSFRVTSLSVERQRAVRNAALQEALAESTGGKGYDLTTVGRLPDEIRLEPRIETHEVFIRAVEHVVVLRRRARAAAGRVAGSKTDPPGMTKLAVLRSRLGGLRRQRRLVRLATGYSALLIGVSSVLAVAMLADWLLLMSVPQRVVALVIWLAVMGWVFFHYTLRGWDAGRTSSTWPCSFSARSRSTATW